EPTTHQYDYDVATSHAFLQHHGLADHFKFNIEANHATLAGHTFEHELHYARVHNMLGSVDANQGDPLLGWDTDEFPTDLRSEERRVGKECRRMRSTEQYRKGGEKV